MLSLAPLLGPWEWSCPPAAAVSCSAIGWVPWNDKAAFCFVMKKRSVLPPTDPQDYPRAAGPRAVLGVSPWSAGLQGKFLYGTFSKCGPRVTQKWDQWRPSWGTMKSFPSSTDQALLLDGGLRGWLGLRRSSPKWFPIPLPSGREADLTGLLYMPQTVIFPGGLKSQILMQSGDDIQLY